MVDRMRPATAMQTGVDASWGGGGMKTVYDFVTVICFACIVITYFLFTEGGMKTLGAFHVAGGGFHDRQPGGQSGCSERRGCSNALAIVLIAAGIGYTYIIVRQ